MSHLDQSIVHQQKFSPTNRTNSIINVPYEVPFGYHEPLLQMRNDVGVIGEKNMKLKEDYVANKAKLAVGRNGGVMQQQQQQQQKRISSMDSGINNQQWNVNQQQTLQFQQQNSQFQSNQPNQQFRPSLSQTTQLPFTPIPYAPQPNQQNRFDLANTTQPINSQFKGTSSQIESLTLQINQYTEQISNLQRSSQTYKLQVSKYKQMINKLQSFLHQKESTLITQRTQILKQKQTISQLERQVLQLRSSRVHRETQRSDDNNRICGSCQELKRKVAGLTRQITELTIQVNGKTERVRLLEREREEREKQIEKQIEKKNEKEGNSSVRLLQAQNKQLQTQLSTITAQFTQQISHYQTQLTTLNKQLLSPTPSSPPSTTHHLQQQLHTLRQQNLQYRQQLHQTNQSTQQRFSELMQENQQLGLEVGQLRTMLQERDDQSRISSQQESMLQEYERAIQVLQEEVQGLRGELASKQEASQLGRRYEDKVNQMHQHYTAQMSKQFEAFQKREDQLLREITHRDNLLQYHQEQDKNGNSSKEKKENSNEKKKENSSEEKWEQQIRELRSALQQQADETQRLINQLSSTTDQLTIAQQKINFYSSTLEDLQKINNDLTQRQAVTQQHYVMLQKTSKSLQQEVQFLQSQLVQNNHVFHTKTEEQYMKEIADARHQLQCSKKMIAQLFSKIEQNNEQQTRTQQQIENKFKTIIENLQGEIIILKAQIKVLRSDRGQVRQKAKDEVEKVKAKYVEEGDRMNVEIQALSYKVTQLEQDLSGYRQQANTQSEQVASLRNQIEVHKREYQQTYTSLVHAQQHISQQQKRLHYLQNQLNILNVPQTNQEQQLSIDLKNKIGRIGKLEEELAKMINQNGLMRGEVERLNERVGNMQRYGDQIVEENGGLYEERERLNEERERLHEERERLNGYIVRLNEDKGRLQEEKKRLEQVVDATRQQLQHLHFQHQSTLTQLTTLTSSLTTLTQQRDHLTTQLSNRPAPQTITVINNEEVDKLAKENRLMESQRAKLVGQVRALEIVVREKDAVIRGMEKELKERVAESESLRLAQADLSAKNGDSQEVEELRGMYASLSNDTHQLSQSNQHLQSQVQSLQTEVQTLHSQLTTTHTELTTKTTELTHLQTIISTKQTQISNLQSTKNELSRYIQTSQDQKVAQQQQQQQSSPESRHIDTQNEINQQLLNYEKLIEQLQKQKLILQQYLQNAENYIFQFQQKNYQQIVDQLTITIRNLQEERARLLARQKELEYQMHTREQPVVDNKQTIDIQALSSQYEHRISSHLGEITALRDRIILLQTELTRLQHHNTQLQTRTSLLTQQTQRLQTSEQQLHQKHNSQIQQLIHQVKILEGEKETFLREVDQMKNKLVSSQPQTVRQVDQSRVKVDQFVEENRRIVERLTRAEGYIQVLEARCEEYLAEIERLRNIQGSITPSLQGSRITSPPNPFHNDSPPTTNPLQQTPINKINQQDSLNQAPGSSSVFMKDDQTLLLRVGELQEIVLGLRREVEEREQHIRNAEGHIVGLEREREVTQGELKGLVEGLRAHEGTIGQLKGERQAMNQNILSLTHTLSTLEATITSLQHQRQTLQQNITHLTHSATTQHQTTAQQLSLSQNEKKELERLITRLQSEKAILGSENQRLNEQVGLKGLEVVEVERRWEEAKLKMSAIVRENERLSEEIKVVGNSKQEESEGERSGVHMLEQEIQALKMTIQTLQLTIQTLQTDNNHLHQTLLTIQTTNTHLNQQLTTSFQQTTALQASLVSAQSVICQHQATITQQTQHINSLQTQLTTSQAATKDLQTALSALETLNNTLHSTIVELEGKSRAMEQTISSTVVITPGVISDRGSEGEVAGLRTQLERRDTQLKAIIQDLNNAEAFIAENEAVFLKAEEERGKMQQRVAVLEGSVTNLTSKCELLQQEIVRLNEVIEQSTPSSTLPQPSISKEQQHLLTLLQQENHTLKNDLHRLSRQLEAWQHQVTALNAQIAHLRQFQIQYHQTLTDLQTQTHNYQQVSDQYQQASAQLAQIENERLSHERLVEEMKARHREEVERIGDEKRFLEDSIGELNGLIERDRMMITGLKDQVEAERDRHLEEVRNVKAETQRVIEDRQKVVEDRQKVVEDMQKVIEDRQKVIEDRQNDSEYIAQLESQLQAIEGVKTIIETKLQQAELFIQHLEQQRQNQQQTVANLALDVERQNKEDQLLMKLVEAQSRIMELEKECENLAPLNETLLKEKEELVRLAESLEKQKAHMFLTHDQKINQITQRNLRIQEELQQTVFRVSQEHMQIVSTLEKIEEEKKTLEIQLTLLRQKEEEGRNKEQVKTRVLQEMRATISRLIEENKFLISENAQIKNLKEEKESLTKLLNQKSSQSEEFQKAIGLQTQQVYQLSTQLTKTQNQIAVKSSEIERLTQANTSLSQSIQQLRQELSAVSTKASEQPATNQYSKMADSLQQITLSLKQKSQLINSLQASLRNERNKSVQAQKDKTFFESKLLEAEEYIGQTERDKRELAQKYEQLNTELEKLRLTRIEERPNEEGDNEQGNSSIANVSEIREAHEEKLKELQETVDNQDSIIQELNRTIAQLEAELARKQDEISTKKQDIQAFKQSIAQLEQQKQTANSNILELSVEIDSLSRQVSDFKQTIQSLQKQLREERQVKQQLKNALQQSVVSQTQAEQASKVIINLQNDIEAKATQIQSLTDQLSQQQRQKLEMENAGQEAFTRELQAHKRLNEELIKVNRENLAELNMLREKALQTTELKHHAHQLEQQVKENEQVVERLIEAESLIEQLNQEKTQYDSKFIQEKEKLQNSIKELQVKLFETAKVLEDLQKAFEEEIKVRDQYKAETDRYATQVDQTKAQVNQYKAELDQHKTQIEQYKTEVEQLKTLVDQYKSQADTFKVQVSQCKTEAENQQNLAQRSQQHAEQQKNLALKYRTQSEEQKKTIAQIQKLSDENKLLADQNKKEADESKKFSELSKKVADQFKKLADQSKSKIEEQLKLIESLKQQAETIQKQSDSEKKGTDENQKKILDLTNQVNDLVNQLTISKQRVEDAERLLGEANSQVANMEKELTESKAQVSDINHKLVQKKTQSSKQKAELKTLEKAKQTQIDQLAAQLNTINQQVKTLTQQNATLTQQTTTQSQQLKQLQSTTQQKDTTIIQLQTLLAASKQTANITAIYEQQLTDTTKRLQELLTQQTITQSENDKLSKELTESATKLTLIEKKLNEVTSQNREFMNLNEHLMDEISEEHMKVQRKQYEVDAVRKELEGKVEVERVVKGEVAELKGRLEEYELVAEKLLQAEKHILSLQQKLSSSSDILKQSVSQKQDLLSSRQLQLSHLSSDLKQISNKLTDKQQQLLLSQNELIEIRNKISLMEKQIEEEEREKIVLRGQLDESVENSHEITLLNDRLNESEKELMEVKVRNRDLELRNGELQEANKDVEGKVGDLQIRNNQLLSSLQRLSAEFSNLQTQNTILTTQLQQAQNKHQAALQSMNAQTISQKNTQTLLEQQLQQLKLKHLQKEQQLQTLKNEIIDLTLKLGNCEVDIENYKRIIEETSGKDQGVEEDMEKLKESLKHAEEYITGLDTRFSELNHKEQELRNENNTLQLKNSELVLELTETKTAKSQDQSTINQLQATIKELQSLPKPSSQTKIPPPVQQTTSLQKVTKLVQKLTKFVEENDSLDIYLEQNIERDLSANPIFKNLYETIKYKLRLLNAIDKEKTVNLAEKQKLIEDLKRDLSKFEQERKDLNEKASQAEMVETSYHEVLAKLIEMERQNISLENQVNHLTGQLSLHKSQLEEFQSKLQNESSSLSAEGDRTQGQINGNGGDLFIDEKLKEENLRLRKELEQAQYHLHKAICNTNNFDAFNNSPIVSPLMNKKVLENNEYFKDFLNDCLSFIGGLQENVAGFEKDIILNRQSVERFLHKNPEKPVLGSKGSEDSWMFQKIQQLEEKLLWNEQKLREHKNQTEVELINLVRQSVINPLTQEVESTGSPIFDRERVEMYLRDLEEIIVKKDIAHEQEVYRLKSLIERPNGRNESSIDPHKEGEQQRNFDVDDLLREIAGLNKHIQIYHTEANRRKQIYKRTIEQLLQEIENLKVQFESVQTSGANKQPVTELIDNITSKTKNLLEQQSSQDLDQKSDYLNDDDFIVSNNYVQWITKKGTENNEQSPNKEQQQHFVHDLKSIAEEFQNRESSIPSRNNLSNADNNQNVISMENRILNLSNNLSKEELLSRPILEFIVQNKDFDETQINLLKKKISEIQMRSTQQKMRILKENDEKLAELLLANNLLPQGESRQAQIQTGLTVLGSNLSKQQVQKLVSLTDPQRIPEELMSKLQQVLSVSQGSSFLRQQNNSFQMMQNILQTKNKYYPQPTPLSEEMYHHLIKLLSSKDDQEFYLLVDSLFSYLSALENDFLNTLRQKEEMYQKHTEKMNAVLGLGQDSEEDIDLEDEEYYKKILLLTKDEQAEIEKLKREDTEKGISQQLQEEIQNATSQQQE